MIKRLQNALVAVIVLGGLVTSTVRVGATPSFTQYPLPGPASQPVELVSGPDGAVWFTEGGENAKIGRITSTGTISEFAVPVVSPALTKLDGIIVGPDNALWYTYTQDRAIGRITTDGTITKYPIPFNINNPIQPSNLTIGPDGAIWFAGGGSPAIGRITTSGNITLYPLAAGSGAVDITLGPDGALWFTGHQGTVSSIGRMTTAGAVTWYQFSPNSLSLNGIVTGPDGALWFTAINGNLIGRVTTSGTFASYSLTNSGSEPWDITNAPDGALWFTENSGQRLGRITTDGVISEYAIPPSSGGSRANPTGITTGPDGALWFAAPSSNQIGRLQIDLAPPATGNIEYPVPGSYAFQIAKGSDGALWFTETGSWKIGRITTGGSVTEHTLANQPRAITAGPDGALWFTEQGANKIGRISTNGVVTEYPSGFNSAPNFITAGPDGAVWFTEWNARIGRITTAGTVTHYNVPGASFGNFMGITTGPDGALWFAEYTDNKIGKITTSGVVTEYAIPTANTYPYGISAGSDGAVWFGETIGNNIGRITTDGTITEYPVPTTYGTTPHPSILNLGPDGNVWFIEENNNALAKITPTGTFKEYQVPTSSSAGMTGFTLGPDNAWWYVRYGSTSQVGRFAIPEAVPPVVTGTADHQPNVNGWYDTNVTIQWHSVDPPPSSGTPSQPAPTVANQEGDHTYTSDQSCDPAGNCATGSLALKIDKTAPTIAANAAPVANAAGWNNSDVTVSFACDDSLSGVDTCADPVTVTSEGAGQTATGTATDKAGNTASVSQTLNIDKTAPTINYTLNRPLNLYGWQNDDVTVTFNCSDQLSGVASCPDPVTVGEGANQTITGTAQDRAGNASSIAVVVSVDKTTPTIAYAITGTPNAAGWYAQNVVVDFQCQDGLSGILNCTPPVTLSTDGANQSVTGSVMDLAFNTQSVTASGLNLDKTAPAVHDVALGSSTILTGQTTNLSAQVDDQTSGIERVEYYTGTTDPGQGNATAMSVASGTATATVGPYANAGTYVLHVRARDIAGNWSPVGDVSLTVANARQLSAVAPAQVWIGLKNSDDNGVKFDLLAEVFTGNTLVTSGQLNSFGGGSSGFNNAHLATIPLDAFAPSDFPAGTPLSLKISVRNACSGSGHNSGFARLWYNDSAANSRFGATIASSTDPYYLLSGNNLSTAPGSGPKATIDVAAGAKCSPFKPFGSWAIVPL